MISTRTDSDLIGELPSNMATTEPVSVPKEYKVDAEAKAAPEPERLDKINSTWEDGLDSDLDRRISRKFDTHIVPWLFGLWLLAFIDRSNIGNARIDGLATDLDLTANRFNVALAIFYVPYICYDVCGPIRPFQAFD